MQTWHFFAYSGTGAIEIKLVKYARCNIFTSGMGKA